MKRVFSVLFSVAMMAAFVVPATASQNDSTPDVASPQASPSAADLQPGVTEYIKVDEDDGEEDLLSIDLTALESDMDGVAVMDSYDPEADAADGFVFDEEHDAPQDCRLIEYTTEDDEDAYIGICADDEFGLWVVGSDEDDVEHVLEQFSEGETNLVPADYEEADIDEDVG